MKQLKDQAGRSLSSCFGVHGQLNTLEKKFDRLPVSYPKYFTAKCYVSAKKKLLVLF